MQEEHTNFFLMRHGESKANKLELIGTDTGLTQKGIKQVQETADKLGSERIEVVYSSPLIRAKQTAVICKNKLSTHLFVDKRLQERNYGSMDGTYYKEYEKKFHTEFANFNGLSLGDQLKYRYYLGYETASEMVYRFSTSLATIGAKHTGKNILIISHSSIMTWFLVSKGIFPHQKLGFKAIENAGYVKLCFDGNIYVIKDTYRTKIITDQIV